MMEEAIRITRQAEIFLIVGTSLVVYPAAGLVSYVQPHVPKFIVDKKVPILPGLHNLTPIEKGAGEGMKDLMQILAGHQ